MSFNIDLNQLFGQATLFSIVVVVAFVLYYIFKRYILELATKLARKSRIKWDNHLVESGVLEKLVLLIPIMVFSYSLQFFPESFSKPVGQIIGFLSAIIFILAFDKVLNTVLRVYNTYPISNEKPIKGYIQLVKILVYLLGIIVAICLLVGISPWGVLSGLGALTAILMFVFKDTILSLVASVQITANDLFKVGDWIEVPGFGADGTVIDIALHSVKVENFDKTIVNIPTYKFLDVGIRNWRGMEMSGGRRIMRQLLIDTHTIRFATQEDIARYQNIEILQEYLKTKAEVIHAPKGDPLNKRELTNIGTFRAYVKEYLIRHPKINNLEFTFLVRQLQSEGRGVPIQVYAFANDNRWAAYEDIQSDIFDHLIVAAKEFGLELFQEPTGDFSCIKSQIKR